ncbi:unnamed protein product [Merluccius merluccius]
MSVPLEYEAEKAYSIWPDDFPVQPNADGLVVLNPQKWAQWLEQIEETPVQQNVPQRAPATADPQPEDNEIHPWALGGYLDIDITGGRHVEERTESDLAILEFFLFYSLNTPHGTRVRTEVMNLFVLGVVILTSGGSITSSRLRKLINVAEKELMIEHVDITREMVQRGWDFLTLHCGHNLGSSQAMEELFATLRTAVTPVSLRLSLMMLQTELKMLTGIVTIVRAINGFQDFPWQDLSTLVTQLTGVDEMANVADLVEYIDPPKAGGPGGRWSGWTFALRTATQGLRSNSSFPNLLYTAVQLSIQAGGDRSLRGYQGLSNLTVQARGIIDSWIAAYIGSRAPAGQGYGQNSRAPDGPSLTRCRTHRL